MWEIMCLLQSKNVYACEKYLNFCSGVQLLTKLRSGTLKLNVETGCYSSTLRKQCLCNCRNKGAYINMSIELLPKYYIVLGRIHIN